MLDAPVFPSPSALAPKGRQSIARGVSPWDMIGNIQMSPGRGDRNAGFPATVAPSGLAAIALPPHQGLTPLAIDYRPSGAHRASRPIGNRRHGHPRLCRGPVADILSFVAG